MKRLFTLILIPFLFGITEVKAQIMWERIEVDTITYLDEYHKILVKDSLIYLQGNGRWHQNFRLPIFYSCYNFNGKLKWRKQGQGLLMGAVGADLIIDSDSMLLTYRYDYNKLQLELQKVRMATGDTLPSNQTITWSVTQGFLMKEPGGGYTIGGNGPSITRINNAGVQAWGKRYTWGFKDTFGFVRKSNGNYLLAGSREWVSGGNFIKHPVFNEFNSNGDTIKTRVINIEHPQFYEDVQYNSLIETRKGEFLFTARVDTVFDNCIGCHLKYVVAKVDNNLNLKWVYANKGQLSDYFFSYVYELADSSYVALAGRRTQTTGDYAIIKISKTGQYISHTSYTSPSCNGLPMIWAWKLLPDGTSIVAGKCKNNGYSYVARLASVGAPAVLGNPKKVKEERNFLAEAFPNPATGSVTFIYNLLPKVKQATISITDLATGREVRTISLKIAENHVKESVTNVAAGMYAYTLWADGIPMATRKLVVVK